MITTVSLEPLEVDLLCLLLQRHMIQTPQEPLPLPLRALALPEDLFAKLHMIQRPLPPDSLSAAGLAHLLVVEGSRTQPYQDVAGLWTIGIGHLLTQSELASGKLALQGELFPYAGGLDSTQIAALLSQDLKPITLLLTRQPYGRALTQGQYDCLCSFVFNVGRTAFLASTIQKKLLAGDFAAVPEQLRRWIYAGGRVIAGLRRRREQEIALWHGEHSA